MKHAKQYGKFVLAGAATYWGADSLIQVIHPPHVVWILLLTIGVPFVVWFVWYRLYQLEGFNKFPRIFPLFMLLGIWLLGPLAMAITAQVQGGTFMGTGNAAQFLMVWAMFPLTTFVMSTYSGSLGGLMISSVLLIILSLIASAKVKPA